MDKSDKIIIAAWSMICIIVALTLFLIFNLYQQIQELEGNNQTLLENQYRIENKIKEKHNE